MFGREAGEAVLESRSEKEGGKESWSGDGEGGHSSALEGMLPATSVCCRGLLTKRVVVQQGQKGK
jgi:hypothetical protein